MTEQLIVVDDGLSPLQRLPARDRLLKQIDDDIDAIYADVQGNRASEYAQTETEALAFKAAGYTGTVPSSVAEWAAINAKTPTWATDNILATATAWRGAMVAMRDQRWRSKDLARTAADLAPVAAGWAAFVVVIRAALGVT